MLQNKQSNIHAHNDLKRIFSCFGKLCEGVLQDENQLLISFENAMDDTIQLLVLGQPFEITFSMILNNRQASLGKLNFAWINEAEKNESVWTLFFETNGQTRYSPDSANNSYNLNDPEDIHMVLVHLVVLCVRQYQLSSQAGKDTFIADRAA
jgi:hypothetical protein